MASAQKPVLVALQGGGALGAFTAGVLQSMLADQKVKIEGISGTSAGAVNGLLLASALAGPYVNGSGMCAARGKLAGFWNALSLQSYQNASYRSWWDFAAALWNDPWKPEKAQAKLSPIIPMLRRYVLEREMAELRDGRGPLLLVDASEVGSDRERLFYGSSLSYEAVAASAALPPLTPYVPIGGKLYADGMKNGSNPPLIHLLDVYEQERGDPPQDIIVILINPVDPKGTDVHAEWQRKMNVRVLREMQEVAESGRARLHPIIFDMPAHWTLHHRYDPDPKHIAHLQRLGHLAYQQFAETSLLNIGVKTSYTPDLHAPPRKVRAGGSPVRPGGHVSARGGARGGARAQMGPA